MHVLPREVGAYAEGIRSPGRARSVWRLRWGLRGKLLGLALAALLPALFLAAVDSLTFLVHERDEIQRDMLATAHLAAQQARELARGTERFLGALGEVETVKRGSPQQRDGLFAALVSRYSSYNAIFFLDVDGREQGISTHQPGQERLDTSQHPYFQEALQTRSFSISRQPLQAPSNAVPVVRMVAPVLDERGSLLGFVGAGVKMLGIDELWADLDLPPGTVVSLVERDQGVVIASSREDEASIGQRVADEVAALLRARAGGTFQRLAGDAEWLGTFARIEGTPWSAIVEVPAEVAYVDWRAALTRTAALLLLAFVLALGLARALAARLAEPVQALTTGALALATGQLQHRVVVRTGDELERVADQFNAMAAQLERERALLDERVAAATAAERRRAEQRDALQEAARTLVSQLDRDAVLYEIVAIAERLLGIPSWNVRLLEGDELVSTVTPGLHPAWAGLQRLKVGQSLSGWVAQERQPVVVPDMRQDPRFCFADLAQQVGLRSYVGVPLLVGTRLLGVLSGGTYEVRRFSDDEVELLVAFANYAAIALQNADAFTNQARLERLREEFLTVAAHELRTPLTSIHALAQLLLRNAEAGKAIEPERLRRNLATILRQSQRLNKLILDLLDVSRLRQDHLELRPAPADLVAVVRDAVEQMATLAEAGQHRLALDVPVAPLQGVWDVARVEQVVLNLLSNALRFSPSGTEVRVALAREADGVLLSVADQGHGIPPNEAARLFRPFERALDPLTRYQAGLGLGLYLSRGIVEGHGGRIWAELAEEQGTTFYVWLPVGARGAS